MTLPEPISTYINSTLSTMEGWCTPQKATALAELVLTEKPSLCLEIGVFGGRSLCAIALACVANDHGRVIGIDPWSAPASVSGFEGDPANRDWWNAVDHDSIYAKCKDAISTFNLKERVTLARLTNEQALPLVECMCLNHKIDFAHFDGNHSEQASVFDVTHYLPLISEGAIVCFDDVNWLTTQRAQSLLLEQCDLLYKLEADGQACAFYRKRRLTPTL